MYLLLHSSNHIVHAEFSSQTKSKRVYSPEIVQKMIMMLITSCLMIVIHAIYVYHIGYTAVFDPLTCNVDD
jgi:hypothetical protein